jgi:hypothetical protein
MPLSCANAWRRRFAAPPPSSSMLAMKADVKSPSAPASGPAAAAPASVSAAGAKVPALGAAAPRFPYVRLTTGADMTRRGPPTGG